MAKRANMKGYKKLLLAAVGNYGGWFNAHAHIDRADTLDERYLAHKIMDPIEASSYPLSVKQSMTGDLHTGPAYEKEDLERRMDEMLDLMKGLGVRRLDSFIDVTGDRVKLTALDVALELKKKYEGEVDFRPAAYPIFGFKDSDPERWELFVEGAKKADYIGTLPERDARPHHIGYDEHMRRVIALGQKLKKEVHMHVDQANDPRERGTETLIEAVRWLGSPETPESKEGRPSVWAVHSISPSTYDEDRFRRMLDGLLEHNIGVICCPIAAISMRQLRPISTPTYNSIARVLEMAEAGVNVAVGSDNIWDVYVPTGTPDMSEEFCVLSNAVRFYYPDILAKIGTGTHLNDMDRALISRALDQDREVWERIKKEMKG